MSHLQLLKLKKAMNLLREAQWDSNTAEELARRLEIRDPTQLLNELKDIASAFQTIQKMFGDVKADLNELGTLLANAYDGQESLIKGIPYRLAEKYHRKTERVIRTLESQANRHAGKYDVENPEGLTYLFVYIANQASIAEILSQTDKHAKKGRRAVKELREFSRAQTAGGRVGQVDFTSTVALLPAFAKQQADKQVAPGKNVIQRGKRIGEIASRQIATDASLEAVADDYKIKDKDGLQSILVYMLHLVQVASLEKVNTRIEQKIEQFAKQLVKEEANKRQQKDEQEETQTQQRSRTQQLEEETTI